MPKCDRLFAFPGGYGGGLLSGRVPARLSIINDQNVLPTTAQSVKRLPLCASEDSCHFSKIKWDSKLFEGLFVFAQILVPECIKTSTGLEFGDKAIDLLPELLISFANAHCPFFLLKRLKDSARCVLVFFPVMEDRK